MHVTLIPYIRAARELKTKPTQQSIAKLREIGLQPQVLLCRTEHPLDAELRQKLSMFCNVSTRGVIEARDVEHTIYEMPLMLNAEGLDDLICELLHVKAPPPNLTNWRKFVERVVSPKKHIKIAVVGKYIEIQAARFARENKIPYLGLCLGMQVATIEFARNVCGLEKANSTEFDEESPDPVISDRKSTR